MDAAIRAQLAGGLAIPAHPLALDTHRNFDKRSQRALSRYYLDAGSGGLAVGDEPMPLADMLAAGQSRQQVGVGRTCLRDPLDRRDQNSTAAAVADSAARTPMKR